METTPRPVIPTSVSPPQIGPTRLVPNELFNAGNSLIPNSTIALIRRLVPQDKRDEIGVRVQKTLEEANYGSNKEPKKLQALILEAAINPSSRNFERLFGSPDILKIVNEGIEREKDFILKLLKEQAKVLYEKNQDKKPIKFQAIPADPVTERYGKLLRCRGQITSETINPVLYNPLK
jgi:hypothetical protein